MASNSVPGGMRAVAVAADGTIVASGTLVSAANPALVALLAWQVLAVITAQKFLSDINNRLANIEREISSIKQMLDDQTRGRLLGAMDYLRSHAHERSRNETERAFRDRDHELEDIDFRNQLQAIHVDCLGIANAKRLELTTIYDTVKSFAHPSHWLDNNYSNLEGLFKKTVAPLQVYLTACHVGFVSAAFLNELPNGGKAARANLNAIETKNAEIRQWISDFKDTALEQANKLCGSLTSKGHDLSEKERMKKEVLAVAVWTQCDQSLDHLAAMVSDAKRAAEERRKEEHKPLTFAVELGPNNEVTKLWRISEK